MFKTKPLFVAILACGAALGQTWNHDPNSPNGPQSWGYLGGYNAYATCGTSSQAVGTRQAPIDIVSAAARPADVPSLTFNYVPTALAVENLGHVIEVANEEAGSVLLTGPSPADRYRLVQLHFHTPSEHRIDGRSSDMELHLVHQNALGETAVVGVLLQADDARANPAFTRIFNNAPKLLSGATAKGEPAGSLNPLDLLPRNRAYYAYAGSLTTPPCSEGVHWYVLAQPVYVTSAVVAQYQRLLTESAINNHYKSNNRPVQPLNGRAVIVSH